MDLSKRTAFLPSFLEGSDTLFIGQGSDIAFVDFSRLNGKAVQVSPDRTVGHGQPAAAPSSSPRC